MEKKEAIEFITNFFKNVYCDTCGSFIEDDRCDECHRKNMNWSLSAESAEYVIDKLGIK